MEINALQALVVDALEDIKGKDIEVIDTSKFNSLFDRLVIASGDSNRQTRALARHVQDKVKEAGGSVVSIEGEETGEWVLVDLGDVVVHVMQPAVRAYYNLEELWSGAARPSDRPAARSAGLRGAGPGAR
jgi:ribosome-associated protein